MDFFNIPVEDFILDKDTKCVPTFKKGDKVKTRDGNTETVLRINSNGNVETVENDYSWPPYTLELVERAKKVVILSLLLLVSFCQAGNAQNSPLTAASVSSGWDSDEVFMSGKPVVSLPRYGGICTQSVYTGKTKIVEGQEYPIYIDGRDERTYYPILKDGAWKRRYFREKKFKLPFLYVGE